MLSPLFLVVSTLAWIPAKTCIVQNDNELPCSTCILCAFTKDIHRYWRVHDPTNITCRLYSSNSGNKSFTAKCAFTIYLKISNNPCLYRTGGNGRVVARFAVFGVRLEWFLKKNGHIQFEVETEYLPILQVRAVLPKSKGIHTCVFYQGSLVNMLHHVRLKRRYLNRVTVLMREIRMRGRSSVLRCKKCYTASGLASRAKRAKKKRRFDAKGRGLFKRSLREKRNILKNISTSTAYSTYLPDAGDSSKLPVTKLHTKVPQSLGQSHSVLCPQTAVINSLTIFLTHSASGEDFKGTLVPTSVLTPLPEAIATTRVAQDTMTNGSNRTAGARLNVTAPLSTSISQARARKQTVTFIYDSRLVSIVSSMSASDSSYVFITTWNCASVTRTTQSHVFEPTLSSVRINRTSITPMTPSKGNQDNKRTWEVGLIVGGATILGFALIIVLALSIRRYQRSRRHRRKAKQISYFNRYDRSSAWEEPFGGSKLSVFTLKNSKFDIDNDWETSNEPRRGTTRSDDFEGK